VLSIAVGLLAGLVMGSFATGWYIVPTEVAIATVRTAADEMVRCQVLEAMRLRLARVSSQQRKEPARASYSS